MLVLLLSFAWAAISVQAQTLQCRNANVSSTECPTSYGGYHLLCGVFTADEAVTACAMLGYRLAMVPDSTALQALFTLQECALLGTASAWVGGWNGMGADPCAYLDIAGGVVVSPGWEGCNSGVRRQAMCQVLPEATAQFTEFQVFVTATGTSTQTVSICTQCTTRPPLPTSSIIPGKNNVELGEDEKRGPRKGPRCNRSEPSSCRHQHEPRCPVGPCTPVCPFTVCGLHVVQADNLTFENAAEECAKYGWNLADTTSGQHADIAFLQRYCGRPAAGNAFWIRSFNGVDGGLCAKALGANPDENVPVGYGVDSPFCTNGDALPYALCQDAAPAVTGTGVFVGPVSYISTEIIQLSTVVTLPSTTTTTTVTRYFNAGCQY